MEIIDPKSGLLRPALEILLVIVVLGAGAYYLWGRGNIQPPLQQPATPSTTSIASPAPADQTADWKTYTDPQYGFSFKYPLVLIQGDVRNFSPNSKALQFSSSDSEVSLSVWVADTQNHLYDAHGLEGMEQIADDTVTIGGYNWEIVTNKTDVSSPFQGVVRPIRIYYDYEASLKDRPFFLEYSGPTSVASREQLNQILSTLKFTQPTSSAQTTAITILIPNDIAAYDKAMANACEGCPDDVSATWPFVKKTLTIPYTTDIIRASAEAAAEQESGQGEPSSTISYFKISGTTAYVLTYADINGWAGASVYLAKVHPFIKKTLLQFPQIHNVVFRLAPGDELR